MTLRRFQPGERIKQFPGGTWNELVERARRQDTFAAGQSTAGAACVPQTGIRWIKNDSGVARNRFDVLGISDVFPTPTANADGFKRGAALEGTTPDEDTDRGRFAVLLAPARAGDLVPCCVDGLCVAKVLVDTNETWIDCCDVKDGDAGSLQLDLAGTARVLWRETGTGTKWAIVRLGVGPGQTKYRGKLDGALAAGSYATVSIWRYTSSDADTGVDVTAHDWLLPSGLSLDTETPVTVEWSHADQRWYVTGWQHTTETVVTDLQVDGSNSELEKKTNTVTVPAKGTESGWTVWHTGDTCS